MRLVIAIMTASTALAAAAPHAHKAASTHATSRFTTPSDADASPAVRYGALSPDECTAELTQRKIAFSAETARGVAAPVRLLGTLRGVAFHTDLGEAARATSPWEIGDCRLVLALDDFAEILARHDIVEVIHYSMYRVPPKSWAADKIGGQHNGGLALDAAKFVKSDGTTLSVLDDFHGAIGAATCGKDAAPHPVTAKATELRSILCEAVDDHLFNVVLTPDYNRPHRNHFHLEVTAGVRWFLVH